MYWQYTVDVFPAEKDIRKELENFGNEEWEAWAIEREEDIIRIYFKKPKE